MGRYAELPYYFERLDRRLYSVEELCFLLVQSAYMMEDDFPDEGLILWIKEQCGLDELARLLEDHVAKNGETADAVRMILEYVQYSTREEIERTVKILYENMGRSMYEKRLARAGHFLQEGRLLRALAEYEEVRSLAAGAGDSFEGRVLHNEAVICARLFMFDRARELFEEAYDKTGSEASYLGYLAAVRMNCSESEYVDFIGRHPESHGLSLELEKRYDEALDLYGTDPVNLKIMTMHVLKNGGKTGEFMDRLDEETSRIRQEYRTLVGQR
jgi:tetratricopeptide (TPR) repeat protein